MSTEPFVLFIDRLDDARWWAQIEGTGIGIRAIRFDSREAAERWGRKTLARYQAGEYDDGLDDLSG